MKYLGISCVGIFLVSMISLTFATVGGQYSVNVHFVPPLVTAQCSIAQFWSPPNVTCALCFCMTGSLSRCIPQPGCNPQTQNSTTTLAPDASTDNSTTTPLPVEPGNNTTTPSTTTPAESASSSPDSQPGDMASPSPTEMPAPPPAESEGGKRQAKPGKPKRKRYLIQH